MNFKKLFCFIAIIGMALTIASCGKENDDDKKTFNPTAIETLLKESKNNYVVELEGVVYGIVKNGFYVSDSELGKIFVIMGSTWEKNVALGDKVQITGVFSIVNNQIQIKSVSNLQVASHDNQVVKPTATELKTVVSLANDARTGSLAKYVTVTGTIDKSLAGFLTIYDDEGNTLLVNDNSNTDVLEQHLAKRVSLPIIVHNYSQTEHKWVVSFAGTESDITSKALTVEEVKAKALADIQSKVPTEVYGALELPTTHSIISYITYDWEVVANDYLTINEDGSVSVTLSETDHEVTLKANFTDGVNAGVIDYQITLKGIVEQTLGNMLQNAPKVNYSVVKVSAVVVSIIRNQSLDIRSFIVVDPTTNDTITVDIFKTGLVNQTSEAFTKVKVGDEILVTAEYRNSETDRKALMNVQELLVKSSGNEFSYDLENAYVLNDQTSYNQFAENLYANLNKLVKIEKPFMNYSTKATPSDTNWVRLGWNETSGNAQHGQTTKYYYSLLIAANNETLGSSLWHEMFAIPFVNEEAKQFVETIYAYPVYVSGIVQFIVPDWSCYILSDYDNIRADLGKNIPVSTEIATILLPTTHEKIDENTTIAWTSSNPDIINPTTGAVNPASENVEVTLTATFTLAGQERTIDFVVSVLKVAPLSITELYAETTDSKNVKVHGVVIGLSSDGNDQEARKGLILLDNVSGDTLLVCGLVNIYANNKYPSYFTNEGTEIKIGDEIQLTGVYYENTEAIGSGPVQTGRRYVYLNSSSVVTILNNNVTPNFQADKMIVIDSNEDLVALAENVKFGQIIKFVGTMENPIYVGSSASKAPANFKICMYDAVDNAGTKYSGQTFSLKSDVNEALAGSKWYEEWFGYDTIYVAPNTTNKMNQVIGEMYCVICNRTSTYFQMTFVNVDAINVCEKPTIELLESELTEKLPATIESGDLDITLLTTHKHVTGSITWTSSNPEVVNLETKKVAEVKENTEVTLTASFTFNGVTSKVEHKVTVLAKVTDPSKTVSAALTTENGKLIGVYGIIAGYHKDSNTAHGIILLDKTDGKMLFVHGFAGEYGKYTDKDNNVLVIGDEIEITSAMFYTSTSADYASVEMADRKMLAIVDSSEVTRKSQNNELKLDYANALVIDSTEDFQALADNVQYGVLIKLTGTSSNRLYMGNNSTKSVLNLRLHFNGEAGGAADIKFNGKYFSCQAVYNEANMGAKWYDTYFGTVAISSKVIQKQCTGDLYVVLTYNNASLHQLSVLPVGDLNTLREYQPA